ncbi:MAG: hypothetical protein KK482_09960 [Sinorhizobium meliloti]|nr:hypothetical protein [Sinorhizobium meliloti]
MKFKKLALVDGSVVAANPEYIVAVAPGGVYNNKEYTKVILNAGGEKLTYSVDGTFFNVVGDLVS